ncbi:hypothetical protein L873DRAFT_191986 [Choiromyces venosus 120613-1]|uniref:Uncharacterized protein n=1 Tax=Choiromyces venosus 120613-1 TaxID=1336337 RepID=A0A3N4J2N7_9PEZI|nr:hypothetical protein L873DRAFT_191986 [Choiromyces venosus 120613-1]
MRYSPQLRAPKRNPTLPRPQYIWKVPPIEPVVGIASLPPARGGQQATPGRSPRGRRS